MSSSFKSETYNLNTLLGRTSFPAHSPSKIVVPPFQRSFSWQKTHVSTFWEDFLTFHKELKFQGAIETYFLGPIVVLPEDQHMVLLDGQQRLATVTILFCVLRDLARKSGGQPGGDLARDIQRDHISIEEDDSEVYSIQLSDLDHLYFQTTIQKDPPDSLSKPAIRSHRLIQNAQKYLTSAVQDHVKHLKDKDLVTELKSLKKTLAEKVKLVGIEVKSEDEAFLIFETLNDRGLRLSVPDLLLNHLMRTAQAKDRVSIRDMWDRIVEKIGHRKVSTFLRHMWVSLYGDVKSQSLYREIRSTLKLKKISSLDFVKTCASECEYYVALIDLDLSRLGEASQSVEALVKHLRVEKSLPILLSGLSNLKQNDFKTVAKATLDVVARHSVFADFNPAQLEDTLYSAARTIRRIKSSGKTSSTCKAKAIQELGKINPTNAQVKLGIKEVFLNKDEAKYVVREIAKKLQSGTKVFSFDQVSVEHVYPSGALEKDWPNHNEIAPYEWHIGNLTLLEPSLNKVVGRQSYKKKCVEYKKSEIAMTRQLASSHSKWEQKDVLMRSDNLAATINKVWTGPDQKK